MKLDRPSCSRGLKRIPPTPRCSLKIKGAFHLCPLGTWPNLACDRHSIRVVRQVRQFNSFFFFLQHRHPQPVCAYPVSGMNGLRS